MAGEVRLTKNDAFNSKDLEEKVSGPQQEEMVPRLCEESSCLQNNGRIHILPLYLLF